MNHRPIGIGVQGLADTFALLGIPFESDEAKKLNKDIFETIYFAAMTASNDVAKKKLREAKSEAAEGLEVDEFAGAYSSFSGSPLSEGQFQFNLWGINEDQLSGMWDWAKLRKSVMKYGVRNSLLLAPMPTASTAQILGNNECFEPYTNNLYKRNTLSGEFVVVNRHLVEDLIDLGLWGDEMRIKLIQNNGSIQTISEIPDNIKAVYKTVWEMKSSNLIDMSAERGAFICQSQSMNLFLRDATVGKLNKALFYGWKKGLKTGMYYLRSNAKATASIAENPNTVEVNLPTEVQAIKIPEVPEKEVQVNVSADISNAESEALQGLNCSLDNPDDCLMCGS
jgi:ribonucleoside-diphosphate reductase alpha chain